MTEKSTKEKILKVAHKLFADKGFNGTSVREISKQCKVNIAAISYHFCNKENLYIQTIKESIMQTNNDIREIYENLEEKDIKTFSMKIFEHFLANSEDLRTAFKLVVSTDKYYEAMAEDMAKFRGPPGGEYMFICLRNEFPDAKEEDLEWAIRVIFAQVFHKSLVMCNESICESMKNMNLGPDKIKNDLVRLVDIIRVELGS